MKSIVLFLIIILFIGCSTMPQEYETTENKLKPFVYGVWWGVFITGTSVYAYYYLDEKTEWF